MTLAEIRRDAESKLDAAICEEAARFGNRLLARGHAPDDLPELFAPWLKDVRAWRAAAMDAIDSIIAGSRGQVLH